MDTRRFESVRNRALFGLQVFEFGKPFEVSAQMGDAERSLKTLPTERLCLNIASQGLHHFKAYLLPFERNPTRSFFIDGIDSAPCLISTGPLPTVAGQFRPPL